MTRFRAVLPILAAACLLSPVSARSDDPIAVVAIELNNSHVIVPVDWAGQHVSFVLDTGAPASFLDLETARTLGVPIAGSMSATGAGSGSTAGGVLAAPVPIQVSGEPGPISVSATAALDMRDISAHAGRDIAGVLGADFIGAHVLEIDYEHRRLRLYDPVAFHYDGPGTAVPLHFKNRFPMTPAMVRISNAETFEVDALLDVGASGGLVLTQPVVVAHDLVTRLGASAMQIIGRGAGGDARGQLARLPTLSIGAVRLSALVVALAAPNGGVMSTDTLFGANIGGGAMRHFTMFFDYRHAQAIFEPNGVFGEPFEGDMSGIALTTEGRRHDRVIAEVVRDASPAFEAGVRAGDCLVSIDGRPAAGAAADAVGLDGIRERFRVDQHRYVLVLERDGVSRTVTLTTRRLV